MQYTCEGCGKSKPADEFVFADEALDQCVECNRALAMAALRNTLKRRKITYRSIGWYANKSVGWIGEVLRGHYPHYGGNRLPKNIREAIEQRNIHVPEILVTF